VKVMKGEKRRNLQKPVYIGIGRHGRKPKKEK
jgi:hypothetical protein